MEKRQRTPKRFMLFLAVILLAQPFSLLFGQTARAEVELGLNAESAVLMDAATGTILYALNENEPLPPASMAKMMTEYLVFESIKSGKISMDSMVTTSEYAASVIGSGGQLAPGETLTVRDMLTAVAVNSANDASVALAEHIAGSEEAFAKMMNEKARELGLSDKANFINATGLGRADMNGNDPKSIEGETMLTAKDAALLAYHLLKDHSEVLEFSSIPKQKLRPQDTTEMVNWNWMLEGFKDSTYRRAYAYEGMDGLKTGHTKEAGWCFTGTAERNGIRLISVVMRTPSEQARFQETRKLLDYGFNTFEYQTVVSAGSEVEELATVEVKKAAETTVPVVTESDLTLLVDKNAKEEDFVKRVEPADDAEWVAPLPKGTVVGKLIVEYKDKEHTINLVTAEDAKKAGWFKLFFRGVKGFFSNLFDTIKGWF